MILGLFSSGAHLRDAGLPFRRHLLQGPLVNVGTQSLDGILILTSSRSPARSNQAQAHFRPVCASYSDLYTVEDELHTPQLAFASRSFQLHQN